VTLGSGTGVGGFFPDGLKGVINGTAGSGAAAANLPPVPAAPVASPAPAPTVASPAPVTGAARSCPSLTRLNNSSQCPELCKTRG